MIWKSIRLELASTREFPAGSVGRAFLVNLPLDDHDVVDGAVLAQSPSRATVRRHWSTQPDERGQMIPLDGDFAMRCEGKPVRLLRFNGTPMRLGQQVSIVEADGTVYPLRVASIR